MMSVIVLARADDSFSVPFACVSVVRSVNVSIFVDSAYFFFFFFFLSFQNFQMSCLHTVGYTKCGKSYCLQCLCLMTIDTDALHMFAAIYSTGSLITITCASAILERVAISSRFYRNRGISTFDVNSFAMFYRIKCEPDSNTEQCFFFDACTQPHSRKLSLLADI